MIALRAAGVMLVLDTFGPKLPRVVHWGADLGPLDASALDALRDAVAPVRQAAGEPDEPVELTILPVQGDGSQERARVRGHRDERRPHPRFVLSVVEHTDDRVVIRGAH